MHLPERPRTHPIVQIRYLGLRSQRSMWQLRLSSCRHHSQKCSQLFEKTRYSSLTQVGLARATISASVNRRSSVVAPRYPALARTRSAIPPRDWGQFDEAVTSGEFLFTESTYCRRLHALSGTRKVSRKQQTEPASMRPLHWPRKSVGF